MCSFRCGVISWPFSPPSTAAPPTWWWPCGSPCPSGKMRSKNGAILQWRRLSETHLFAAVWCCLQQYRVVVCWLHSLLWAIWRKWLICPTLSPITNSVYTCQVHISRCVIFNLDSFDQILLIKHEITIQRTNSQDASGGILHYTLCQYCCYTRVSLFVGQKKITEKQKQ